MKILRDPLFAFVLIGSLLFLAYDRFAADQARQIVVSEAAIHDLVSERELVLSRSLVGDEQQALIDNFVDREILIREAIARGLYLKDAKIRTRLAQKMDFLLADEAPEPDAGQLQAQFDQNREDYLTPRAVTFEHVFFNADKTEADKAMSALDKGEARPEQLGDVFWLGRRMEQYSSKQLLILLGYQFERSLRKLPVGQWQGPIKSARGWHLVRVEQRHEPRVLPEAELQRRLVADWKKDWSRRQRQQQIAELRRHYQVVLPGQGG